MRFRPSREEFHQHAAEHNVVPVWTELLADLETPVAAYSKLVGDGPGFLLESVEGGEIRGRYSLLGLDPDLIFKASRDDASINRLWKPPMTRSSKYSATFFGSVFSASARFPTASSARYSSSSG